MTPQKIERAFIFASVFKGEATRAHILKNMEDDAKVLSTLSAKQLTAVINVANRSYHDGKSGGVSVEDDCVWIGLNIQQLIPIKALEALEIKESSDDYISQNPNPVFKGMRFTETTRLYSLNYVEKS